jgi:Co/Zn/Cd efflux system component
MMMMMMMMMMMIEMVFETLVQSGQLTADSPRRLYQIQSPRKLKNI